MNGSLARTGSFLVRMDSVLTARCFSSVLLPGCLRERILYNTFPEIPEVLSCPAEAV